MALLDNPYERFKAELKFFNIADMLKIESMAVSMTMQEIQDYFMADPEDITAGDQRIMDKAFKRGRARGIQNASDNLFTNMKDAKSGAAACLSYLKRHAENYKGDVDDTEGKDGFTYTLNINADLEKGNSIQETKEAGEKVVSLKSV